MQLKIYIKQTQQFNINQQPIYYTGPNPQSLSVVINGTLPANRQWPSFGNFIEMTSYVSDLYKLKLTWTEDRDSDGASTPGAFQPKKSASGTITFEDTAYQLIKKWLVDDVSAPLNSLDVKIEHVGCGFYENWTIKATDITWCDDGDQLCVFDVTIKQKDIPMNCIKSTLITDNHQGWFQPHPANGKKHPRFSYCNEIRPNGFLAFVFSIGFTIGALFAIVGFILLIVLIPLIAAINFIIGILNKIINFVNSIGASISNIDPIPIPDPFAPFTGLAAGLFEAAGCGREHPAPLVRDYIYNVCKKCGIEVNETTAPIFFSSTIILSVSEKWRGNNGVISERNPHYNVCYFHAPIKRGIRRFDRLDFSAGVQPNTTDFWISDNAPLLTLDQFLDQVKGVYNAEWRIVSVNGKPTLFFQRKDFYITGAPLLDFTPNGVDRDRLLAGICFEWNEVKYPAACKGLYAEDPIDVCGNEGRGQINGSSGDGIPVTFGQTDQNPNFEGILDKTVQFGAAKFRLDGSSNDYIYDAMSVAINSTLIGNLFSGVISLVADFFSKYGDYALLLKSETAALPKLIIWDGKEYTNARSVPTHSAFTVPNYAPPEINDLYNDYPPMAVVFQGTVTTVSGKLQWWFPHPPQNFVIGSALTLGTSPAGVYKVQNFFGSPIAELPAVLMNYPMYFNPNFRNTLWDWFHWIDDPRRNPKMQVSWTAKVELCCDYLNKLKLLGDGLGAALGQKVKIPLQYYPDSKIKEITVSYDPEDELGQFIEIKGES